MNTVPLFKFVIDFLPDILIFSSLIFSNHMSKLKKLEEEKQQQINNQNQKKSKSLFKQIRKKICHLFWKYHVLVLIVFLIIAYFPKGISLDSFASTIVIWAIYTWFYNIFLRIDQ